MQAAESSNRALGEPEVLRHAGQWLSKLCREFECSAVVAASRSAEWIVAATVLATDGAVQSGGGGHSRVMVVEAAVVTGSAVHHAAQIVRSEGAEWIGAAIWYRTRPDLDQFELSDFDVIATSNCVSQG